LCAHDEARFGFSATDLNRAALPGLDHDAGGSASDRRFGFGFGFAFGFGFGGGGSAARTALPTQTVIVWPFSSASCWTASTTSGARRTINVLVARLTGRVCSMEICLAPAASESQ
jgi:hypothetical protein